MSYSLFPRAGSVGTPSNPKVEVPGRLSRFKTKSNVYQGPVRPTDDEKHFRKTGETIQIKKEVKPSKIRKVINKILDKRMVSRDVVKKSNIRVSLSKLGVY